MSLRSSLHVPVFINLIRLDFKQVSSSSDVFQMGDIGDDEQLADALDSVTDCVLGNLGSISLENVASSPVEVSSFSSSTASRLTTPRVGNSSSSGAAHPFYLMSSSSNMAVNDMTSLLSQLAEENKFRNIQG